MQEVLEDDDDDANKSQSVTWKAVVIKEEGVKASDPDEYVASRR